jgi:hypothetical protein
MANHDRQVLSKIVLGGASKFAEAEARGFIPSRLAFEEDRDLLTYIAEHVRNHGEVPIRDQIETKFPKFVLDHSDAQMSSLLEEWASNFARASAETFILGDLGPATRDGASPAEMAELFRRHADELGSVGQNGHGSVVWSDTIAPAVVKWLWDSWIPRAALSLIIGDPGSGKGLASTWMLSRATNGRNGWPKVPCGVVGHEDAKDLQVGRLEAAGAGRVAFLGRGDGKLMRFPDDAPLLRSQIEEHDLEFVVIDPVQNHLADGLNPNQDRDLRAALTPVQVVAQETGAAILIVHHMSKSSANGQLLYRAMGSVGYSGIVRAMLAFGAKAHDEEDEDFDPDERFLFAGKSNYGRKAAPLRFTIEESTVAVEGKDEQIARLVYQGEAEGVTEAEVFGSKNMSGHDRGRGRPRDEDLRAWIEEQIDGRTAIPTSTLEAACYSAGRNFKIVKTILAAEYGWSATRDEGKTSWTWRGRPSPFLKALPGGGEGSGSNDPVSL